MHLTLYPSSPSDAAAEAPARPAPTTMMSNLRLLLGLTSLYSNLALLHFPGSGPEGILAFSSIDRTPQRCTTPVSTAIGNEMLASVMIQAKAVANQRRQGLNVGLFQPIDWKRLQRPWNRWKPSRMLASM